MLESDWLNRRALFIDNKQLRVLGTWKLKRQLILLLSVIDVDVRLDHSPVY